MQPKIADYFAPLLPWQKTAWQQLTEQYHTKRLPHGLLAAGVAGIGKRAFVHRLVAWLLCEQKPAMGACGVCTSCQLLKSPEQLHPDVHRLGDDSIKIEDIRRLQDFFHAAHQGVRIILLDNSEKMTQAAANALLKTLEEPNTGIYFILITNTPSRLLATIKSRVQTLPLTPIDPKHSLAYVSAHAKGHDAQLLLAMSDFAPLLAADLPNQTWFLHRQTWLTTFAALQIGKRTPVQASDYWQSVLSLGEFLILSRSMISELWRWGLGMQPMQNDIDTSVLRTLHLTENQLDALCAVFDESVAAGLQNVQEKLIYDRLFVAMTKR